MKRLALLLPLLALAAANARASFNEPKKASAAAPAPWLQADFAANLHRSAVAAGDPDANAVISPWGVASIFALLQTGARGDTARDMARALLLGILEPPAPDETAATFRESGLSFSPMARTEDSDDFAKRAAMLGVADGATKIECSGTVWLAPGFDPAPEFLDRALRDFHADVRVAESGDAGRAAADGSVSDAAPNLPEPPFPGDPLDSIAAVGSVRLQARWSQPFSEGGTSNRTFHAASGDCETPFLHATRHAEILDAPECSALRLPYRGDTLEMLVLLPSSSNTLADVEVRLGSSFLDALASSPWLGEADIAIPKFGFGSKRDLKPVLSRMGMDSAFDPARADFSGIAPKLYLSAAVQNAGIAIDERGTEAFAETCWTARTYGVDLGTPPPPRPFVADRPFLFLVRESRSGLVLFLGRVCNPAAPATHADSVEGAKEPAP